MGRRAGGLEGGRGALHGGNGGRHIIGGPAVGLDGLRECEDLGFWLVHVCSPFGGMWWGPSLVTTPGMILGGDRYPLVRHVLVVHGAGGDVADGEAVG